MAEDDTDAKTKADYPILHSDESTQKRLKNIAKASSPTVTSDAITHAINAQFPQTRYAVATVGPMSAAMATTLAALLPDRVLDALMYM